LRSNHQTFWKEVIVMAQSAITPVPETKPAATSDDINPSKIQPEKAVPKMALKDSSRRTLLGHSRAVAG
jgi:hypothetical protein